MYLDTVLLERKIEDSGLRKSKIAEMLGITRQGLYKKISGDSEFKSSEIKMLSEILNLDASERDTIFFADYVDKSVSAANE